MKLAINGGTPVRSKPWPKYPIIGDAEKQAVLDVLDDGQLVSFRASLAGDWYLGSTNVKKFERLVADYHNVKYAVAFTSATAALHGAVVACGVKPLSEVIVTPYSFSASATAPLMHNAIPVFADVTFGDFCLDPASAEARITDRTQAIIPVHLFGYPAEMDGIMALAGRYDLKIIEDCAQAPGALYKGQQVGTIGDCGVFSFVGEKNASCGEGGMLITDDDKIAAIARLVRNHGDAIHEPMLGFNYRMTEYQAALGAVQWGKLDGYNEIRIELADYLSDQLRPFPGITPFIGDVGDKHVYYVYPVFYDAEITGIPRNKFVEALNAEGIPFGAGYNEPLSMLPIFTERAHFAYQYYDGDVEYGKGVCPVAEMLWEKGLIITVVTRPPATFADMDDIARAFEKVLGNASSIAAD